MTSFERRIAELEQQVRESEERNRALSEENKAQARDLSKLDAFKRSIMQSIQDEDVPGGFKMPSAEAYTPAVPPPTSMHSAPPPYTSPAPPPPATSNPLGGHSAVPASVGGGSGFGVSASPAPPAAMETPSVGEAPNAAAVMDGKDFFRQARLRLTYEQFNQFLSNIKRLNDHAQTRDETLARAQDIFGADNGDLFASFKSLLSKHGLT